MDHDVAAVGDHHGQQKYNTRKRAAEDAFEVQSGISNHFKRLRLNHAPTQIYNVESARPSSFMADHADLMQVEETPSKIYIHDLAAEIAEIEASEPKDFFLADVDKKVSAIPATLLQGGHADPNMQLVLYRDPSSISVPEEEDAVRKAIVDARKRLRKRQRAEREEVEGRINGERRYWPDGSGDARSRDSNGLGRECIVRGAELNFIEDGMDHDPDAMDIG